MLYNLKSVHNIMKEGMSVLTGFAGMPRMAPHYFFLNANLKIEYQYA